MTEVGRSSHCGAAVIITDLEHGRFIVQRKDDTYRAKALRGGLSLIGGGMEPGEEAQHTVDRELGEEIADARTCSTVRSSLKSWKEFSLQGECKEIAYNYRLSVFVSELEPDVFSSVAEDLGRIGGLNEGTAELLTRHEVQKACCIPNFIWGIERVLDSFLSETEAY